MLKYTINEITLNFGRNTSFSIPFNVGENQGVLTYSPEENKTCSYLVTEKSCDGTLLFDISCKSKLSREFSTVFSNENSIEISLDFPKASDIYANVNTGRWWTIPQFCKSTDELGKFCQGALLKTEDRYVYILPLSGDNFRSHMENGKIHLSTGWSTTSLQGCFLAISESDDPYEAVSKTFRNARKFGAVRGMLLNEKKIPEPFNYFGICTWDMFYHDMTSEKIYQKLDELKEKGVPVKWMILDNGWLLEENEKLLSFKEDMEKFPEGMKQFVKNVKEHYSVEYVGLWHTFNGYWWGIEPDSDFYRENSENLDVLANGSIAPSGDPDKAYKFWESWYSYFKECGIDMVKVDSQSSFPAICDGSYNAVKRVRVNHNAMEKAIYKYFDGNVINCMGMDMENALERSTAISRTSGDFSPVYPDTFYKHLKQNIWNGVWHGEMYIGDYDMFWSGNEAADREGVARAISGGPIYISDKIGITDYSKIRPCILEDGRIIPMDTVAKPTKSVLFTDCTAENRFFRAFNKMGKNFALAVFSDGELHKENIVLNDVPEIMDNCDYLVYEYFTKEFIVIKGNQSVECELERGGVRAYSIMPIFNGKVEWGDNKLYFPPADPDRILTKVEIFQIS